MPLQLAKASENGDATFSRLTMANIGPHSIVLWAHWCGAMRFGCEFGVDTVWGSASVAHHMLIMHTVTFWRSCCPWIIHVGVLHANIQTIFTGVCDFYTTANLQGLCAAFFGLDDASPGLVRFRSFHN
jgi:hypothetical protein